MNMANRPMRRCVFIPWDKGMGETVRAISGSWLPYPKTMEMWFADPSLPATANRD
jgi:hypothetical protein